MIAGTVEKCSVKKKFSSLSIAAILSFLGSLAFCSVLTGATIINRANLERHHVEQLLYIKNLRVNDVISILFYRANALSALIVQGDGVLYDFESVAPILMDHPAIFSFLIAPEGIVSNIYPRGDSKEQIGQNFFDESAPNREAIIARDFGILALGSPFESIHGDLLLSGKLPVYIDTPSEKNKFWGLVSVTLGLAQALTNVELEFLKNYGFAYELWTIDPDTNEKHVILGDYENAQPETRYIEGNVPVFNLDWHLTLWPIRMWYHYSENLILATVGLLISFLVFFVVQHNSELKQVRLVLENEARTDPLTGIHNRRHFMDILLQNNERARRLNGDGFIIIFDLDRFKDTNDTHGHVIGDKVLIETTSRIKAAIRTYDLFARYGGEEFIIYASDIDRDNIRNMAERLRLGICNKVFEFDDVSLSTSASFGIAYVENYDIDKAILNADKALYTAKREGRNRTVFWDDISKASSDKS